MPTHSASREENSLSNRVLVVDDKPMLYELIHDLLTPDKIEAVPISNSAQASALFRKEKFDAVCYGFPRNKSSGCRTVEKYPSASTRLCSAIRPITDRLLFTGKNN
jgi:DNA-binding NtrC family response regulator